MRLRRAGASRTVLPRTLREASVAEWFFSAGQVIAVFFLLWGALLSLWLTVSTAIEIPPWTLALRVRQLIEQGARAFRP